MSSTDKNSEVAVEVAAEEKAETKEIKATKRPAEVSIIAIPKTTHFLCIQLV